MTVVNLAEARAKKAKKSVEQLEFERIVRDESYTLDITSIYNTLQVDTQNILAQFPPNNKIINTFIAAHVKTLVDIMLGSINNNLDLDEGKIIEFFHHILEKEIAKYIEDDNYHPLF